MAHLLGISYAPRLKSLDRQTLYVFRSRRDADRSSWTVTPDKYINTELVKANWDDILRVITTIKLKETTASDIFRRLNSYATQHLLYRALKAFGQIIKSLFILRYINDLVLRQAVEQQLIPNPDDHDRCAHWRRPNRCAHWRRPMDMIFQG